MKAGCPGTSIPTPATVGHDIKISFEKCCKRIDKILKVSLTFNTMTAILIYIYQEHPGHIHFTTNAWTSQNHRAFVAWTVHLHHEGNLLVFILDIIEVPEVS